MAQYDSALLMELGAEDIRLLNSKPSHLNSEDRLARRRLQNRLAAQNSRTKKRQHTTELETTTTSLQSQYDDAKQTVDVLRLQVNTLLALLHRTGGFVRSIEDAVPETLPKKCCYDEAPLPHTVLALDKIGLRRELLQGLELPGPTDGLLQRSIRMNREQPQTYSTRSGRATTTRRRRQQSEESDEEETEDSEESESCEGQSDEEMAAEHDPHQAFSSHYTHQQMQQKVAADDLVSADYFAVPTDPSDASTSPSSIASSCGGSVATSPLSHAMIQGQIGGDMYYFDQAQQQQEDAGFGAMVEMDLNAPHHMAMDHHPAVASLDPTTTTSTSNTPDCSSPNNTLGGGEILLAPPGGSDLANAFPSSHHHTTLNMIPHNLNAVLAPPMLVSVMMSQAWGWVC